jgi:hypothetical protein
MKGLAPIYSCTEKCGVKGQKTVVDDLDKVEEAGRPYVRCVTLVPLVCLVVHVWPQWRQRHLSVGVSQEVISVLVVVLHLKNGVLSVFDHR